VTIETDIRERRRPNLGRGAQTKAEIAKHKRRAMIVKRHIRMLRNINKQWETP
jgi:hypothetical protein